MKNELAQIENRQDATLTRNTIPTPNHAFLEAGFRRFSSACVQKLNDLKEQVTDDLTVEFRGLLNSRAVRQFVNEADALAAATPFPTLFLPLLAEEKVRAASAWSLRQRAIREGALTLHA